MVLRTIQVVLSANVAGFAAGMGTASAAVKQLGNEANAMATRTDAASKQTIQTVGRLSLALGIGLAAALALSIRAASDFEVQMRNVASISDYTRENFDQVSDSLLNMSRQMPQSASVLAKGLYDIASSGFDGAEAMNVLQASAKAASAGLTDTATAAKGDHGCPQRLRAERVRGVRRQRRPVPDRQARRGHLRGTDVHHRGLHRHRPSRQPHHRGHPGLPGHDDALRGQCG